MSFGFACFLMFVCLANAAYDFHISLGHGCPVRWRGCYMYCTRKHKAVAGFCATVACACIPNANIDWDKFMDEVEEKLNKMGIL